MWLQGLFLYLFHTIIYEFSDNCVSAEVISDYLKEKCTADFMNYKDGIEKAVMLAKENNGVAVICGSLYLASAYLKNYTE